MMASKHKIIVDIAGLTSFLKILRNRPGRGHLRMDLVKLNSLLNELEMTLELHIRGSCIAITGFEIDAPLESLFGFKQLKLSSLAMIKSALRLT